LELLRAELTHRSRWQALVLKQRVDAAYDRLLKSQADRLRAMETGRESLTERLPDVGFLRKMGYAVGRSGKSVLQRRRALDEAYRKRVPTTFDASYRDKWGMPGTEQRLHKIVEVITFLAQKAQRRNQRANFDETINDYRTDLAYLKTTYYDGRRTFYWPTTQVA
jgi:hypothetical protein